MPHMRCADRRTVHRTPCTHGPPGAANRPAPGSQPTGPGSSHPLLRPQGVGRHRSNIRDAGALTVFDFVAHDTEPAVGDAPMPPVGNNRRGRWPMPGNSTAPSLNELLATATSREPWFPDDTKSGARFERVVIDGERFVLKSQDASDDWLMRATGDTGERYVRLWTSGLLARLPAVLDHAVVAADTDGGVGRILLFDVSGQLLIPGAPLTDTQHERFLDHMAALH